MLIAGMCTVGMLSLPAIGAAANTWYASPTGGKLATCSKASRCHIETALGKAKDGDTVSLASGDYTIPFGGVIINEDIDFGGEKGDPAVLESTETGDVQVNTKVDATLHDLKIEGNGALLLYGGFAERVYVSTTNPELSACLMEPGTTLRDSVCWAHPDESEIEEEPSHGVNIEGSGETVSVNQPIVLRNVTAWTTAKVGNGIHVLGAAGAQVAVDARNVIARSQNDVDVVAELGTGGNSKALVNIANSNFESFVDEPSEAAVTPPGTAGNISSTPSLVNTSEGDFHQTEASPTLDGGAIDALVGPFDLDGADRSHAKCFGTNAVPDMGAYERTPTAQCPPPPPIPPPPPGEIKPVFRIVSLMLNKKTGGGRILVEVPGAGTLSLAGSGVKLVRRTAPAEGGVISMPIQLWVITRVRLAKVGKTRVRLKVIFDGRGSGFFEWSKGVVLKKPKR